MLFLAVLLRLKQSGVSRRCIRASSLFAIRIERMIEHMVFNSAAAELTCSKGTVRLCGVCGEAPVARKLHQHLQVLKVSSNQHLQAETITIVNKQLETQ